MAHLALYRKYRSQDFQELSGQDHIAHTLRNALRLQRIAQAYLFCGPRGTGKTSTARIFAKALNCVGPDPDHPLDHAPEEPCNRCRLCRGITEGACLDVIEMDAASNTGVDNVREAIIGKVDYAPVEGRRKVYIIDEVHKLSGAAFSALLKTVEEPPPHLVFILATTDPHEVPATIVSRCQRFDFRRIPQRQIVARLEWVCGQEGWEAEAEALATVAEAGDGSLRDGLVILEQAGAFAGGAITASSVAKLLGITDSEALFRFADVLLERNLPAALDLLDELVWEGKDLVQLARDLLDHLRALLVTGVCQDSANEILKVNEDRFARLREQAQRARHADLMRWTGVFMELDFRDPSQVRLNWEMALIRVLQPGEEAARPPLAGSRPPQAAPIPNPPATAGPQPPAPASPPRNAAPPAPPESPGIRPAAPSAGELPREAPAAAVEGPGDVSLDRFVSAWDRLLDSFRRERPPLHGVLREFRPVRVHGDACILALRPGYSWHQQRLEEDRNEVIGRLAGLLGRAVRIQVEISGEGEAPASPPGDSAAHERFVQETMGLFPGSSQRTL